ncbi:MAG: aminoglycoside phosphotransferase family protein [Alphaproteobacteria bacterium]|nr:aminoglycoside phosphotransferase family protein [Alphaproteobacteria bacterium]
MSLKEKIKKTTQLTLDHQVYTIDRTEQYSGRVEILFVHNDKGNRFVVVHPKISDKKELKKFFERRRKADQVRVYIQKEYKGPVFLPPIFIDEKQGYVLTPDGGKALSEEAVAGLPPKEQIRLQRALATFLNETHQRSLSDPKHLPDVPDKEKIGQQIKMTGRENEVYFDCLFKAWKGLADPKLVDELKHKIEVFRKRDRSDEIAVLVHNDFDPCNVLYDKKTKKISVIDYEFACVGSVYEDFCHFGGLVWPKEFMYGMVRYYNALTKKSAHPTPVSLKKLNQMWEIAALYNQACWIKEWAGERSPSKTFGDFMKEREKLAKPITTRTGRTRA